MLQRQRVLREHDGLLHGECRVSGGLWELWDDGRERYDQSGHDLWWERGVYLSDWALLLCGVSGLSLCQEETDIPSLMVDGG